MSRKFFKSIPKRKATTKISSQKVGGGGGGGGEPEEPNGDQR